MFDRIKIYKRYRDYYALKSFEVITSLILTFLFAGVLLAYLQIYENFSLYIDSIKDMVLSVIAGNFGLLGMALAGMAIITSLFSPEVLKIINRVDKNDTVNRVLSSFEFSALNILIQIIYLIMLFFTLASNKHLICKPLFMFFFILIVYHLFFNLFYILALIGNCIKLNSLKTSCEAVKKVEKSLHDLANEVRIDYLLSYVLKMNGTCRRDFLSTLDSLIDSSEISEKEELKHYLHNYYPNKGSDRV